MQLTTRTENQVCIISITGDLSIMPLSAFDLADNICSITKETAITTVILNFSGVNDISSYGIGNIMKLYKELAQDGMKLILCELNINVRETFTLTGFDKLLNIYQTETEALAAT